jgi:pre-mRNA-splicing factor ATP-dependent RNA helicase DHX38/PRP16
LHRIELAKPSHPTAQVAGVVVHDSEVLAPEPVRQGGLVRRDKDKQHSLRSTREKESLPTNRPSLLGLDKLADEMRAHSSLNANEARKRRRLNENLADGPVFKGKRTSFLSSLLR